MNPDDASHGTVFVVTHSLRNGGVAPGNSLIDVNAGESTLHPGATIEVNGIVYAVTASEAVSKTKLAADASVRANTPNPLVVITCLQNPAQTESTANLVIAIVGPHPEFSC